MGNEAIDCPVCDAPGCAVKPGGKGGYSCSCGTCGFQGFCKTPKAAQAMRAKLDGNGHGKGKAPVVVDDGDIIGKL